MTSLIAISRIEVSPSRQRREFKPDQLQELVTSIRDTPYGLMHAVVLRPSLTANQFILVAGERRLRAIRDIYDLGGAFNWNGEPVPPGMVPYSNLGDLSFLDAWEAELEENIRRTDLTWQERAKATSDLMGLRSAQSESTGAPLPTIGELGVEVRPEGNPIAASDAARKELIVSRYLHDPEVKAAPSLNEAFKVLKKKEERQRNVEAAAVVGATFTEKAHELVRDEASHWMEGCLAETFDIILTDPPYGMGADEFGDSGQGVGAAAHFYKDDLEGWRKMISWFAYQGFRIAKANAHCYAFCDLDNFHEFRAKMAGAGWKVHRTPLVWSNPDGFRAPWPEQGPQRKYELILYAVKGTKKVTSLRGDVLEYRRDAAEGHPAQKPVALLTDLLRRSALPGDRVLDPFAGSGSTVVACHELKLACTAIEQDAGAYGIAVRRLQALSNQSELLL